MTASFRVNDPKPPGAGGTLSVVPDNLPRKHLIVDPTGQEPNSFKTLKEAAQAAAKEATIELRFFGPIDIEYFRFTESKVTIKGGEGFRPKIVFRPPANVNFTKTYSMATLVHSDMIFENIEIEMDIPQNIDAIADRWTMFDLDGSNTVELRSMILTFINAQRDRISQEKNAFFRCCPVSSTFPPMLPATAAGTPPAAALRTSLTLRNSLVRGEASLLRCDNPRAVQVDADNVLIATNQPVFSLFDIKPTETSNNRITANFNHNTIFVPAMVSWQQGTMAGTIGHAIELSLNDSIVRFNKESSAMAVYAGGNEKLPDISEFYKRTDSNSRTFYQNFTREWVIRPFQSGESPREASPVEFRDPKQYPFLFNTVVWENPFILDKIPVHRLTKNHFLLDENSSRNYALKSGADGTNAGIDPKWIPDPYDSSTGVLQ